VDHAVLATYSADLVAVVTALLALSGADLDHRRTGSRIEVVRAIEALRGRVRVVGQKGRLILPERVQPILALLDQFVTEVELDESIRSWHPKAALVRFVRGAKAKEYQWRLWIGSRNLTRSLNWEAGLMIESRADGKGDRVEGVGELGADLFTRANLPGLSAQQARDELNRLTWDCPPGVTPQSVQLLGGGSGSEFPRQPEHIEQAILISPFLDVETVRYFAGWKASKTIRTLVSTPGELNRLASEDPAVFAKFDRGEILWCDAPELPGEESEQFSDDEPPVVENKTCEEEDVKPAGLHAKMLYVEDKLQHQLWVGSANATRRAWAGRNFEVVARLKLKGDVAEGLVEFVNQCQIYVPTPQPRQEEGQDEKLESERKRLACAWSPQQQINDGCLLISSPIPPPLQDSIALQVAPLGHPWLTWPAGESAIRMPATPSARWCNLIQVRLRLGEKMLSWLQAAPFNPAIPEDRDRAVIAQYLEPRTFLLWLRSLLLDQPARAGGGNWDDDEDRSTGMRNPGGSGKTKGDGSPTVEEILASWARNPQSFAEADSKVRAYLSELEKRAVESGAQEDVVLLSKFRAMWSTLSTELCDE
jgi:hypothetical protein